MSATGQVDTWQSNPMDLGPLYPLVGWEGWMFALSVAIFVAFMIWKMKSEHAKYDHQTRELQRKDK